jgi:hypothetical protein
MSAVLSVVIIAIAIVMLGTVFFNGAVKFTLVDGKSEPAFVDAFTLRSKLR